MIAGMLLVVVEQKHWSDAYDSCREDFSGNDVARNRVTERPAKGVKVNEDDADNSSRRSSINISVASGRVGETNVESKVEHGCRLNGRSDKQRKTSSYAIDEKSDVEDGGHDLDDAINALRI